MREIVKVWLESSYGVFPGTGGVKNTGYVVVELNQSNPYTVRPKPVQKQIRTASGLNRVSKLFSTQTALSGNLNTYLYPEQAAFWMKAVQDVSSGDLNSYTIDHQIVMDDASGTVVYTRHLGCKIQQAQISATSDDTPFKLQLQIVAKQPATIGNTDFPVPALTEFPVGRPYVFTDLASGLTLGTARANYAGFDLTLANMLDSPFFESQYIGRSKWCGRNITWSDKLLYTSAADRTNFEGTTATSCSAVIAGTPGITFNFETANFLGAVDDDLDYGKVFYQTLNWINTFDSTNSTDLTVVVA